jgi:hypothetical protein
MDRASYDCGSTTYYNLQYNMWIRRGINAVRVIIN